MYKGRFLYIIFILFQSILQAQKEDYNWVMGYDGGVSPKVDTGLIRNWGNTFMFFDGSKMDTFRYWHGLNFNRTNASVSDENGDLLFYTNGIKVFNKMHILVENGDSLNFGNLITDFDPTVMQNGYRFPQSTTIVKKNDYSKLYYILHTRLDEFNNGANTMAVNLLKTTVSLEYNNGNGKVLEKNVSILNDTINFNLASCRHSNGKDWWTLISESGNNCFYKLLSDSLGIKIEKEKQCLGPNSILEDGLHSVFSPDGKKYISISAYLGLTIYDFDRCTGMLSNPINIPRTELYPTVTAGIGVAVSPNSRYLYLTMYSKLYQFELYAKDIPLSKILIDEYDGFNGPPDDTIFQIPTVFHIPQLAPDGKIYVSTGNSTRFLHVINDPDKPGKACNFKQHSFRLPTGSLGIPNFPNYRLGAMTCASEIVSIEKEKIKLYPNPVTSYFYIDYGNIDWSGDNEYSISVVNSLGQEVWEKSLPRYSGYQQINMETIVPGVYYLSLKGKQGVVLWQEKVIKQD